MPAGTLKVQADTLGRLKDWPVTAPVLVDLIVVLLAVYHQKQPMSAGLHQGGQRNYNGGNRLTYTGSGWLALCCNPITKKALV